MRHKSEGKRPCVRVRCPAPSTFAGPWIPPPARTTRGAKYGWQVDTEYDKYYVPLETIYIAYKNWSNTCLVGDNTLHRKNNTQPAVFTLVEAAV